MNTKKAYDTWSTQYDSNINKTRDLEALALQQTLADIHFDSCLEIGCGTGKNTAWLIGKAKEITAVDLSNEMLARAKEKIDSEKIDCASRFDWTMSLEKEISLLSQEIEAIKSDISNIPNFQDVSYSQKSITDDDKW